MLISHLSWNLILCFSLHAAPAAKSLQSCPTLCNPIDGSPPGSTVPGILQARTLEWVAISFSNAWKWKVKVKSLSRAWLLATPWTAAHQAPPSMGFSRQEPLPSPSLHAVLYKCSKLHQFQHLFFSPGSWELMIIKHTYTTNSGLQPQWHVHCCLAIRHVSVSSFLHFLHHWKSLFPT